MRREDILEYANLLGFGAQSRQYSSGGWVNFRCPMAPWKHQRGRDTTPSFGIHADDGTSHVWCFTCKTRGTFASFVYELGHLRKEDYQSIGKEIERIEIVGSPPKLLTWEEAQAREIAQWAGDGGRVIEASESWPDRSEEYNFYTAAGHPYLAGRGISATTAIGLGLRWDHWQRRILFPVHTDTGRFAGFSGRRTEPPVGVNADGEAVERDGSPYIKARDYCGLRKRELLLGGHALGAARSDPDCARRVYRGSVSARGIEANIVSEGLFDYAWGRELGYGSVVALLGTALTPEKRAILKRSGKPLILFMDNDAPGAAAGFDIAKQMWGTVPIMEVKYPSGFEDADPASLPASVYHSMIRNAELLTSLKPST